MSVVVPTRGRPELLERCLNALARQTLGSERFEVIVVDDCPQGSAARTVDQWKARQGEPRPTVCYLRCPGRGPAAARNLGCRTARGCVIAFTDDDCVAEPEWLAAGIETFTDGVSAVSGRIVVPLAARPTDYEASAAALEGSLFVTANCFYRRDALQSVGGFDERFRLAWREDTDVFFRLIREGLQTRNADGAVVVHPVRPAGWGVSLRQQRKSYFNALLYKKHPRLYRERVQAWPPWRYYLTVVSAGLFWLTSAADRERGRGVSRNRVTLLRWLSLGAWITLTAELFLKRIRGKCRNPSHVLEMAITSMLIPFLAVYWRIRGAIGFRVFFL